MVQAKATVRIPAELFREMVDSYTRMERVIATLETLAEPRVKEAIEKSRRDLASGDYVECSEEDVEKILK